MSEDAKALSLYLPLSSKHLTYRTYTQLRDRIAQFDGDELREFIANAIPYLKLTDSSSPTDSI